MAACSGVIRDNSGVWLSGFMHNIGLCSVKEAELWGFFKGSLLARQKGFRKVIWELDCNQLVQMISKQDWKCHGNFLLSKAVRQLLALDWVVKVTHAYKEANKLADWLAGEGRHMPLGSHILDSPPNGCLSLLLNDCSGSSYARSCFC